MISNLKIVESERKRVAAEHMQAKDVSKRHNVRVTHSRLRKTWGKTQLEEERKTRCFFVIVSSNNWLQWIQQA